MKFLFFFLSVLLNVGQLTASHLGLSTDPFHEPGPHSRSRIYYCHTMSQEHKTKFQTATTFSEVLSAFPDDILLFDLKQKCSKIFLDKTDEDNRPLFELVRGVMRRGYIFQKIVMLKDTYFDVLNDFHNFVLLARHYPSLEEARVVFSNIPFYSSGDGSYVFANALGLGFSDTRGVVSAEEAIEEEKAKIKESLALLKGLREICPSIRGVGHKDFC
jgi:hypothetical protein